MSDQYFRIAEFWYPEDWPMDTDEETISQLNDVTPGPWEYMVSHDTADPGVYLLEYVGELDDA